MHRIALGLLVLGTAGAVRHITGPVDSRPAAWPHRALLTSLHERPVAFRAYTMGGDLIIAVDALGRRTATPGRIPTVRTLTRADTIHAETPADFPLDLSKGPVVFTVEGTDSLRLAVGKNPYGTVDQVSAIGTSFVVSLSKGRFIMTPR